MIGRMVTHCVLWRLFILSSGPGIHARGGKPPESSPAHAEHSQCVTEVFLSQNVQVQPIVAVSGLEEWWPESSRCPMLSAAVAQGSLPPHFLQLRTATPLACWKWVHLEAAGTVADRGQRQGCLWEEAREGCKQWAHYVLEYVCWGCGGAGWADVLWTVISTSTKASGQMNCWQSLYSYLDSSPPAPRNLHTPTPHPSVVRSEDPRRGHVGQQMLSWHIMTLLENGWNEDWVDQWRRLPAVDKKSLGLPATLRDKRAAARAPY